MTVPRVRLLIFEVDELTAKHLAVALHRHLEDLQRADYMPPESLRELERIALRQARSGPDGTTPTPLGDPVHPRLMKLLLTKEEVAELLGVSPRTVTRLIANGDLTAVSIGRNTRVRRADLERYVDELGGGMHVETKAG